MYEKVCEDDGHLKLNKGAFEFMQVEVQQLLKISLLMKPCDIISSTQIYMLYAMYLLYIVNIPCFLFI